MTDILCRWLNEEVHLEPRLTGDGFAEQFSNGYLFGEVLHRHGLQTDFPHFSSARSSEAKLNNFMRLEPTFRLLEIPFNINMARDIMTEKPGVATRLMYQLFVALNRKKQRQLTGQSLECMRPSGKVKLERIETGIFQEQLKQQTPRQVDLNFQTLINKFHQKQRQHEQLVAREKEASEKRLHEERKEACQKSLEKSCQVRERQTHMYAKLKPITSSKSASRKPKSPHPTSSQQTAELLATERVRLARSKAIAAETRASIDQFESSMRGSVATVSGARGQDGEGTESGGGEDRRRDADHQSLATATGPTADYVAQIKRRVQDSLVAREEREKRRRKVLVEQLKAMHEQEEERREKMLIERLMRQCQQERRIATQLMQIRREKDTIRNNRIFRQQQLEEARLREFQDALDREVQLAKQSEVENQKRLQFHRELYQKNLAEKAKLNYAKNYALCQGILMQMLDFATKMAHYRDLTQGLVPAKIVCDWKMLFIAGCPLYEGEGDMNDAKSSSVSGASSTYDPTRRTHTDNQQLLDDTDFNEYKDCHDEWNPPNELTNELPLPPNPILSHVVYQLLDMVDPPKAPSTPPKFPKSLVRASFIGKPFTGKSTTLQRLKDDYNVVVLSVESVLTKAVDTFFAEKKRLEHRESYSAVQETGESEEEGAEREEEEDAPVISNTEEVEEKIPAIMVEPSSSTDLNMSSSTTSNPSKTNEEGQQEATGLADSALNDLPEDTLEHLSPLARLGYKAHVAMAGGEPLDDETAVEIFVEEIRQLPEGNCWIMDNFPTTLQQAKLLATALTGQAKPQPTIPRQFALLAERQIQSEEQQIHSACGLDIVLHFTASSDAVLQRASQLVSNIPGASNKLEQIQHRLMSFDDEWRTLRRWYLKFRNISTVNSNLDTQAVYRTARDKIQEVINKSKQAEAMKKLGLPEGLGADFGSTSNIAQFEVPSSQSDPVAAMPPPTSSKRRRRRPSSAESPAKLLQQLRSPYRKDGKSLPRDDEVFSPINPNAEPGSCDWVYCSLPLSADLAKGLARKWPAIEETYITTLKGVFQHLRAERENICQYFYDRRNEFADYLCRPDHKQEFVSQWQSLYNSLEPHTRREDAMKAELHHRVDDLCDQLWDITDTRREQAEKERQRIATDHWLEDHIGILTNHFISIMQVELDRFYDTFMLLKDYYTGMEEKVPSKLPDPGRLPLIELSPTEAQEVPGSATGSTHDMEAQGSTTGTTAGEGGEREEGGGETEKEQPQQSDAKAPKDSPKRRVPLLPHQPPPDPTEDKGTKKKGGGGIQSPQPPVEDLSHLELDHQLVVHAFNTANAVVFHLVMGELKGLDASIMEVSKPPSAKLDVEQEGKSAEAAGKEDKGKGKKGKSPAPGKKGKASPAVKGKGSPGKSGKGGAPPAEAPPTETSSRAHIETPEQLAQRQRMGQLFKEHKAAIEKEENRIKLRLVLIKEKALAQINEFKTKDQTTNAEMGEWIQDCYKQEVDCVSTLSEVLRQAVENEEKLVNELALPGAKLEIRQSIMMVERSPPPSPVPVLEPEHPDRFTVDQLLSLHRQLQAIAPSGYILGRELTDTLVTLSNQSMGTGEILPSNWRNLSKEQAELLCGSLYGTNSDFVDWRQFLVCAAEPWPRPSAQDLMDAMQQFSQSQSDTSIVENDSKKDSLSSALSKPLWVTREQCMATDLWLTKDGPRSTLDSEREREKREKFNRNQKLKEAFYEIFSDASTGLVDWHSLLIYLCADPQPREGLCKALTLAVGCPVTSLSPDTVNSDATVLLEDFHKIVSHGIHPDSQIERVLTMSDLLEVFVGMSPSNPNEVSLSSLLSSPSSLHYLTQTNNYTLMDFAVIFQPPSQQNETE